MSQVCSIIMDRTIFDKKKAKKWIKKRKLEPMEKVVKDNHYEYVIQEQEKFSNFKTVNVDKGINIRLGLY
jgi:hypothetical protein